MLTAQTHGGMLADAGVDLLAQTHMGMLYSTVIPVPPAVRRPKGGGGVFRPTQKDDFEWAEIEDDEIVIILRTFLEAIT